MRAILIASVAAILIDQISKWVVIHGMELWRVRGIEVLPPILNFRYGENRGINFGLLDGQLNAWVLIGLAIAICVGVLVWLWRSPQPLLPRIAAGLLIGGALGNVIDRLYYGYVLDFLNMSCCGINNPFVFNVADVFIFAGAIGLVLFADDKKRKEKGA
ncbi:MAG: signal peptidase II [Pseudomonadota bacterium]